MQDLNKPQPVKNPKHYGDKDSPYTAIKVIRAWNLGFELGNTLKYICRAGLKASSTEGYINDLEKAKEYIQMQIDYTKEQQALQRVKTQQVEAGQQAAESIKALSTEDNKPLEPLVTYGYITEGKFNVLYIPDNASL